MRQKWCQKNESGYYLKTGRLNKLPLKLLRVRSKAGIQLKIHNALWLSEKSVMLVKFHEHVCFPLICSLGHPAAALLLEEPIESQCLQIRDKENYTVRIYQCENHPSVRPRVHVCACMVADSGFSCSGICLRYMCTVCMFLAPLRGDPTLRLSPTASVFIATEQDRKEIEREEEKKKHSEYKPPPRLN